MHVQLWGRIQIDIMVDRCLGEGLLNIAAEDIKVINSRTAQEAPNA